MFSPLAVHAAPLLGIIPMKKIVLSFAAVALLAGFVAGCATNEVKEAPKVVRKG